MAEKTILIDDLDGSDATRTIEFSIDGSTYRIDLNDKNAAAFDKAIAKYVTAAASVSTPKPARGARRAATSKPAVARDQDAIRAWARENGYDVADRGRIAKAIVEAYDAGN